MSWDWSFVAEIAVGVGAGVTGGGWLATKMLRTLALEILAHPTTRSLARAAENLGKGKGGAIDGILGFLGLKGGSA